MSSLRRLFDEQKGVCPWCSYTMILCDERDWQSNRDVDATIDHLSPAVEGKSRQMRFKVAAHRKCNNSRGHDMQVRQEIKDAIAKSAIYCGLTKNRTMANHIWSQKILQAFRVHGIFPIKSPFVRTK